MAKGGYVKYSPARVVEASIKQILKKLKAGNYKNQASEDADRRMLEIYLNDPTGKIFTHHKHDKD
jgi:hypothetical protein